MQMQPLSQRKYKVVVNVQFYSQWHDNFIAGLKMADVNKLVFSIVKFLKDQTTQESLSEDAIESLEGEKDIYILMYLLVVFSQITV